MAHLPTAERRGAECLKRNAYRAFDRLRGSIHDVAREAYSNNHFNSYTLSAADFR
jgi:hypothetical protein